MKKIGKIMEDIGFNDQASASSKAAFVKYLIKQAYNVEVEVPSIYKDNQEGSLDNLRKENEPTQMSFNFEGYKKAE